MTLQTAGAPEVETRDAAAAASRIFARLREVVGVDLGSLALFRIAGEGPFGTPRDRCL